MRDSPAVGDEIDPAIRGPHREGILAVVVRDLREGEGLEGADIDLLRLAPLVALPVVELEADLLSGDPGALRLEADPRGRLERDHPGNAALGGHRVDAEVAVGVVAAAAEEDLSVLGPADGLVRHRVIRHTQGLAAVDPDAGPLEAICGRMRAPEVRGGGALIAGRLHSMDDDGVDGARWVAEVQDGVAQEGLQGQLAVVQLPLQVGRR